MLSAVVSRSVIIAIVGHGQLMYMYLLCLSSALLDQIHHSKTIKPKMQTNMAWAASGGKSTYSMPSVYSKSK